MESHRRTANKLFGGLLRNLEGIEVERRKVLLLVRLRRRIEREVIEPDLGEALIVLVSLIIRRI